MSKKIHRGKLLREAIKESGKSVQAVALMVKKSRRTIYNFYEEEHIANADMIEFGKALGVDFSKDLPELFEYAKITESKDTFSNEDYRNKYYELLEVYVKDAQDLKVRLKALEEEFYKKNNKK